jgi:hypothetical protein
MQRMDHTRIPLQTYKYQPSGKETWVDQEDNGERRNGTRGRKRRFS